MELPDDLERLRMFLKNWPLPIAYLNTDSFHHFANEAYENWFGLRTWTTPGLHLRDLFAASEYDLVRTQVESAVLGEPQTFQIRIPKYGDAQRFGHLIRAPHLNAHGQIQGYSLQILEILEERRITLEVAVQIQRRIGEELHDHLGQQITGLELLADTLARGLEVSSPNTGTLVAKIQAILREIHAELRSMARGLVAHEIEPHQFGAVLQQMADRIELANVCCKLEVDEAIRFTSAEITTQAMRIVEEAVSNALRHGKAKSIAIRLGVTPTEIVLEIHDDGCGMQVPHTGAGLGLRLMHERATQLGGRLEISSAPGEGTVITCRLPPPPKQS